MGVRRAVVADAKGIAEVHVAGWQGAYRGIVPDSFLSGLSVERHTRAWIEILRETEVDTFVALDDHGKVVGFVSIGGSRDEDAPKDTGEITSIYVTPNKWRRGYGSALMKAVLDRSRERKFSSPYSLGS